MVGDSDKRLEQRRLAQRKYGRTEKAKLAHKIYIQKNRARVSEVSKNWQLKKHYGITLQDYRQMLNDQKQACAICQSTSPRQGKNIYLHVDHCHTTGKIRGLLCVSCNTALGLLKESEKSIQSCLNYLAKHKK